MGNTVIQQHAHPHAYTHAYAHAHTHARTHAYTHKITHRCLHTGKSVPTLYWMMLKNDVSIDENLFWPCGTRNCWKKQDWLSTNLRSRQYDYDPLRPTTTTYNLRPTTYYLFRRWRFCDQSRLCQVRPSQEVVSLRHSQAKRLTELMLQSLRTCCASVYTTCGRYTNKINRHTLRTSL